MGDICRCCSEFALLSEQYCPDHLVEARAWLKTEQWLDYEDEKRRHRYERWSTAPDSGHGWERDAWNLPN